jgi:integrase
VADLADKIKNNSLTVGDALGIRDVPASLKKNIEAAGLTMDSPWDSIKETDFLKKLNDIGSEANFTTLTSIENELKSTASVSDIPYPFTTVFGAEGKSRKLGLEKAKQARRTKAFKGVPEAKQSLKALTEGVASIKDPMVRSAVAFNALVPLRPGEVAGIKLDDIDFETGAFKEAYRRVNKIRNELDLPEVALEILRDAADTARAEGREYLFLGKDVKDPKKATSTFVNRMTSAVKAPDGIGPRFKPFAKDMGREVAGASDIRKIIPSIIANELGYKSEASAIMGHASFDETIDGMKSITRKHYASQIITGEGTTAKQALRALQNMYGEVLGLSTLNELPASMGVEAKGLTSSGAPRLAVIPKGAEIVGTQVQGNLTDADLNLIDDIREARRQELKLTATESEAKRLKLEAEMGDLDEAAIRAKVRREERTKAIRADERAKLSPTVEAGPSAVSLELEDDLKKNGFSFSSLLDSLTGKKTLGALIGGASVYSVVTEPEAAVRDIALETAGQALKLGKLASAPSMALTPSELTSGELRPEDQPPQDPAGPYAGQDFIPAPEVEQQGTSRTDMARIAREDAGFIPEPSRVPEAAPARDEGFLSR